MIQSLNNIKGSRMKGGDENVIIEILLILSVIVFQESQQKTKDVSNSVTLKEGERLY